MDKYLWWQTGIIYQIYPRSFMDSNGDGVGDLRGILSRLDHLQWLGVTAIWLSPVFPSPMADFGYDISDYTDIDRVFGTMQDFDLLLEETHHRGLKLLLDFVPNHSSDDHPWFLESRASCDNPKRDWYIWKDPAPDGGPPSNWLSVFGGSAWEWDEVTEQYYLHIFHKKQPDLNWRNTEVQEAMLEVMRFWLDRDVDGFRIDVIWHLIKDKKFRDNPKNPDYREGDWPYRSLVPAFTTDQPEVHEVIAKMRGVVNEYNGRLMIGEIYLPVPELVTYYGEAHSGLHLPFNFHLVDTAWRAREIAALISEYEGALPSHGWPNWVLGNHDKSRIVSRVGSGQAQVAAMLLFTLRGTLTLYYGDEIGMHDVEIPHEQAQDPQALDLPDGNFGRDPCRTPMQWNASEHAGFTTGTPWLPVADDYTSVNVEAQRHDSSSMLTLYQRLIALRQSQPALLEGEYEPLTTENDVMAYLRGRNGSRFLIVLNLGGEKQDFPMQKLAGRIILSTCLDRDDEIAEKGLSLRANEGLIIEITTPQES